MCKMDFALLVGVPEAAEAAAEAEAYFSESGCDFLVERLQGAAA